MQRVLIAAQRTAPKHLQYLIETFKSHLETRVSGMDKIPRGLKQLPKIPSVSTAAFRRMKRANPSCLFLKTP